MPRARMSDSHGKTASAQDQEPKTPMWLPAVGAVLFLTVGILWGLSPSAPPDGTPPAGAASGAAADAGARPKH
jgi:hypothetical protein